VSGTGLYTLCADRIWCPQAKAGWTNTAAAIVFHPSSEVPRIGATDVIRSTFVFKCYGGSDRFTDARAVYRALADRLHDVSTQTATEGNIIIAKQVTANQLPADPDTGYPAHMAIFQITME